MRSPLGFRYATAAALIDREGYTGTEAEDVLREWDRYARYSMLSGKSPSSTAEHLARFERYQHGPSLRDGSIPLRRGRPASPERVHAAIADDLRAHAALIESNDPEHAYAIYDAAQSIEQNTRPRTDPSEAAAAVLERDSSRRAPPRPNRRGGTQGSNPTARAGERRVSARGIPFRVCGRGTEIVSLIFPPEFSERDVKQWTRMHGFSSRDLEFPPTTGSIRAPQRLTEDFERGSFRTIMLSERENIRAVIGCPRAGRESDKTKQTRR